MAKHFMDHFMAASHFDRTPFCPYYLQGRDCDCQMTRGGLFIPLPEHVEIFCKTIRYSSCPQYMRGKALIQENIRKNLETADSRRRFPRLRNRFPVILSTCNEKGSPVEIIDSDAMTLDLSLGGMRISSNSPISPDKILHFSFREDFYHTPIKGVGEIRWSRPAEGPLPFEAGIAFLDNGLPSDVGERPGLQ